MRRCAAVFWIVLVVLLPATLFAQTIGAYHDPSGSLCPSIPALFVPTTVYVVASLAPTACNIGIAGAEFKLVGWPTSWFYAINTNPGIQPVGDPFGAGVRIDFVGCQNPVTEVVTLLSITAIPTTVVAELPVTVAAHSDAVAPWLCPLVKLCDAPVGTLVCATPIPTRINSSNGFCPCQNLCYESCPPVALESRSWAEVKQLYN